jgi:hypothetical protein
MLSLMTSSPGDWSMKRPVRSLTSEYFRRADVARLPGHMIIARKLMLASAPWRTISDSFFSLNPPNQLEYFDFSDVLELLGSAALNEVLSQEPIFCR